MWLVDYQWSISQTYIIIDYLFDNYPTRNWYEDPQSPARILCH